MNRRRKTTVDNKLLKLSEEFLKHKLSAAGVSYVVTSKSKYRRNAWIFVLLVTATFMAFMTYKVVREYLQYPKIVLKDDIIHPKLTFPAVTVCTLSPVPRIILEKTSAARNLKLAKYLTTVKRERKEPENRQNCSLNPMCHWSFFDEECVCIASPCETEFCLVGTEEDCSCSAMMCNSTYSHLQEACVFVLKDGDKLCKCKANVLYPKSANPLRNSTEFHEAVETLTDPELKSIITLVDESQLHDLIDIEDDLMPSSDDIYNYGVKFQDFIISCSYEGRKCGKENFTLYFHEIYGKCYMFNFVGETTDDEHTALSIHNFGQTSGLNLVMFINNSLAGDLLTRELGARVTVHDPNELPPVAEFGFNIKGDDYTSVEVAQKVMKRLGQPWGSCVDDGSHLPFKFKYKHYNEMVCKKVCRRTYVKAICNCTKRSFLMGNVAQERFESNWRSCSSRNIEESRCVQNVLGDIEDDRIECKCKPPCKSMLLGLKVYYRTLQVESFEEIPSYSWETLVANIGGNLGFFMGLSIVTFVELCEFLWDVLMSLFGKNKIRDVTTAKMKDRELFSQRLRISILEGKMKEFEVRVREVFAVTGRGCINGEHVPLSTERKHLKKYYRLRSTSAARNRRIRRRTVSTNTERFVKTCEILS